MDRPGFCLAVLTALLLLPTAAAAQPAPLLHSLFQDHGVLQRDRPIAVWGRAAPGTKVRVTLAGKSAETLTAGDGGWRAELPAMPAGGPHVLTATAGAASQAVDDVMVGDVWLCSGQSNTEMAVSQALNAAGEVNSAHDPQMRLLTVAHDTGTTPKAEFATPVRWQPVTPDSVRDFSAACYFMARDLRESEKVPIGLIDASWGGTAVNPWRSPASLAADPAAREGVALLDLFNRDPARAAAEFGKGWTDWWRRRSGDAPGREPWQPDAPGEWQPVPAFDFWEGWGVPALAGYNGIVWYRTEVTLTPAQAAQAATLTLGVADDLDVAFVNGAVVGTTNSWDAARAYPLARGALRPGVNRIVIGVLDTYGPGGLHGTPDQRALRFADGNSVPLPEPARWRYRATPGIFDPPHAPWEAIAGMAGIYNGMIAPLGAYGLRGAAWYQGEADSGAPQGYADRLASMMSGWRAQFANPRLPFLVVQLADWGPRVPTPVESGFAGVRDEQRRAVERDSAAALVVAIDLGEPTDIHPANKQDIGHRLARAARVLTYGSTATPSGPWVDSAVRGPEGIAVRFRSVEGQLVTYSASLVSGFELCGPAPGSCRFVSGHVRGSEVLLDPGTGPAARVRFCWGDSPICNLYDKSGLPAGPFELPVR